MGHDAGAKPERIIVDGWTTICDEWYVRRFFKPPPRRLGSLIVTQLWIDARAFRPRVVWALGGGLILLGLTVLHWAAAVVGVLMLLYWLRGFFLMMMWLKFAPLATAMIKSLRPNTLIPEASFADAVEPDGTEVEVGLDTVLVADLLERDGQCEVLFYRSSPRGTGGGIVLAVREVDGGSSRGDT